MAERMTVIIGNGDPRMAREPTTYCADILNDSQKILQAFFSFNNFVIQLIICSTANL